MGAEDQQRILRRRAWEELIAKGQVPTWGEFCAAVKISDDDPMEPKVIPFRQWPAQKERTDAWFERRSEVILKARQLGFSWQVAAYMLYRAMFNKWRVGYYSRGQEEALHQLNERVLFIWQCLPDYWQMPYNKSGTLVKFANGGSIRVFPSTESAGVGYTFQLVIADEAAHHMYGAQNYTNYSPTFSAGGQYLCLSTTEPTLGPHGFFHDMYQAAKRGERPYDAVFVPWHARPGRDAAWYAMEKSKATSFATFYSQYPNDDQEAFTGREGLVYGMDPSGQLIFDPQENVNRPIVPFAECDYRIAGVDWGGGDPTAVTVWGITTPKNGQAHLRVQQYGEFHQKGAVSISQISHFLGLWSDRGKFSYVECDRSGPNAIAELVKLGWPAHAADTRKGEGINDCAELLRARIIQHDPRCKATIGEYGGYRWRESTDMHSRERFATKTPQDHHGDALDTMRYVVRRIMRLEFSKYQADSGRISWGDEEVSPLKRRLQELAVARSMS